MNVTIDPGSGFCKGVIRAIESAEESLREGPLFSLGAIVHNEAELSRLCAEGMVTIDREDLSQMAPGSAKGSRLLVRAHGEPPRTYERAAELGFEIIDCTCPVVLNLQKNISEAAARLHAEGRRGQIIIFGKEGHAEVLGLLGHAGADSVVVDSPDSMQRKLDAGKIHVERPLEVFSQTTMNPVEYGKACELLSSRMKPEGSLEVHETICRQVATRHRDLSEFALANDVIIFVAGRSSSNGKVLSDLCRSVNIRTYLVSSSEELKKVWFSSSDKVGVCGATSTPRWLLEEVASTIENLH